VLKNTLEVIPDFPVVPACEGAKPKIFLDGEGGE
jgi:hypothetical protein